MGARTIYNPLSNVLEFNEMTINMKSKKWNCFTDTLWLFHWYGDHHSTPPSPPPPSLNLTTTPFIQPSHQEYRIYLFGGYVLNFTFFGIVEKSRNEPIRPWAARNHPFGTTSLLPLVMSQFVVPSHTFSLKLFPSPWGKKSEKKKGEEGRKVKVETALSLLNPKFCPLMPELRKPIFCI